MRQQERFARMQENGNNEFLCTFCGKPHPMDANACPETGNPITPHHKLVGATLENKYYIEGLLGEGGMGVVYAAEHKLIGRKLALKMLFPEIAGDRDLVERLYNEAKMAASIGNEHIIEITDMGSYKGKPFIVMELLQGEDLSDTLKGGTLPLEDAMGIIIQILDALYAVHKNGVIHRDLKPENIFLIDKPGRKNFVKILDFGISKLKTPEAQDMHLTRTGTLLGTPYYMAPEQAEGRKELDHRIDIYATGVILYEMLSGHLPYNAANHNALIVAILTEQPPRPTLYNPDIPPAIDNIIMKAMARDPDQRYASTVEFTEALIPYAPTWVLRASKIPILKSTSNFKPPANVAPPLAVDVDSEAAMSRDASKTHDWMMSDEVPAGVKSGKKAFIAGGLVILLLLAAGAIALTFGPGLWGTGEQAAKGGETSLEIQLPGQDAARVPQDTGDGKDKTGGSAVAAAPAKNVKLTLTGVPVGAVIRLDDSVLTGTTSMIEGSSEKRTLSIEADGCEPFTAERIIDADTEIDVGLKKIEKASKAEKKKTGENKAHAAGKQPPEPPEPVKKVLIIAPEEKKDDPAPEPVTPPEKKGKAKGFSGKVEINETDYPQ
ncbi:MAG: serine/threonine-protein kinase [Pseudomonadota bacterium]